MWLGVGIHPSEPQQWTKQNWCIGGCWGKILNKGNECSQYKTVAAIVSSSQPICPIHIFSSDTQACFALVTSIACQVIRYIPLYTPSVVITCITWTQNMPRHDKVKINRPNGQTWGNNRSSTFVLTAFISFGLFNTFRVLAHPGRFLGISAAFFFCTGLWSHQQSPDCQSWCFLDWRVEPYTRWVP